MTIGLTFILLGKQLPRGFYLLWSGFFTLMGLVSFLWFWSFHASQLVWVFACLLGTYVFLPSGKLADNFKLSSVGNATC
jgi:hypothetical protein